MHCLFEMQEFSFSSLYIRESVDSLCRDGADTPIVRRGTLESLLNSRTLAF